MQVIQVRKKVGERRWEVRKRERCQNIRVLCENLQFSGWRLFCAYKDKNIQFRVCVVKIQSLIHEGLNISKISSKFVPNAITSNLVTNYWTEMGMKNVIPLPYTFLVTYFVTVTDGCFLSLKEISGAVVLRILRRWKELSQGHLHFGRIPWSLH